MLNVTQLLDWHHSN